MLPSPEDLVLWSRWDIRASRRAARAAMVELGNRRNASDAAHLGGERRYGWAHGPILTRTAGAAGGAYADLYRSQFAGAIEAEEPVPAG